MTEISSQLTESHNSDSTLQSSIAGGKVLWCSSCDYTSTNKHYLRQHMDLVHTNDRPFKCPFCDYAGKRSHALKEHLIVHSTERPYQCTQCNATFRKKGHLTNHLRMHSEAGTKADCSLCGSVPFPSRESLYEHLRSEHKDLIAEKVFCCNRCQYATTTKGNLHVHEMAHDDFRSIVLIKPKIPPSANIILKCSECGYETTQRKEFEIHVLERHNIKAYQSNNGTFVKTSDGELVGNKDLVNKVNCEGTMKPQKPSSQLNKCHQCGFISEDYKHLILHIVSHKESIAESELKALPRPPTSQNETEKSYTYKNASYTCNLCQYECESQRAIKAHMWKHSGHKNLEYPTFQNGPLSVFDGTLLAATNFINKDRESVRALFSQHTEQLQRQETSDTQDLIANKHTEPTNNNDEPVKNTKTSPKVIVQQIKQLDNFNNCSYSEPSSMNAMRMIDSVSYSTHSSTVVSPSTPEPILYREGGAIENPLEMMTAVCAVVKRQNTAVSVNASTPPSPQVPGSQNWSDTEQSAATLLSLLRQGPNMNPAVVYSEGEAEYKRPHLVVANEEIITSDRADSISSDSNNTTECSTESSSMKPKTGICSSLLAVIEQLRERQATDEEPKGGSKSRRKRKHTPNPEKTLSDVEILPTKVYPNAEQLTTVMSEGMVYRCKLCHYSSSAAQMKQHLKMHKVKKPHECSLCDYIAPNTSALQDHMIQHCKTRQFQCKQCSAVFGYKSQLRAHTRIHDDGQAFYCNHCEYVTSYVDSFQEHLNVHADICKVFTCVACKQDFSEVTELQSHMKSKCPEVKRLHNIGMVKKQGNTADSNDNTSEDVGRTVKCDQCDFIALSVRSLKSHSKRHINDKRYIQQPLEQYKCNLCGYVCHHMPSLKSHMWRHAGETDFSYSFSDLLNDGSTPTDKHGNPIITLRCCQCGYETLNKTELDNHMKSHWDIIKKTFDFGKNTAGT